MQFNIRIFLGYAILVLCAISMLLPFFWMLSVSFMMNEEIFTGGIKFIPDTFSLKNYKEVIHTLSVGRYFINSFFVAVITTLLNVIISTLAGYAFARLKFKCKNKLFLIVILTMMIPPQVNIIPLFFLVRELNLINTYWALILPGIISGFSIFLMRQYFLSLPKELELSAKIDGCNIYKIFFKIFLPLAIPAITTISIFSFIASWNSFMWPLIVINSEKLYTLPVGLAVFKGSFREIINWGELMACSCISTIPVILLFIFGKKYFINGILNGAIKE